MSDDKKQAIDHSKKQSTASKDDSHKKQPKDKKVSILESELFKLKEEAAQYKDKYIRLAAEFDNARKRMDREKTDFIKYANEGLISEFLNILDDLERSLKSAKTNHQDDSAFIKGLEMIMGHIYTMLKDNNVKPIEAKGKHFDPHYHEAMMQEETDEHEDGTIIEELQKGYMFADRVVRTSKVKIVKNKETVQEKQ